MTTAQTTESLHHDIRWGMDPKRDETAMHAYRLGDDHARVFTTLCDDSAQPFAPRNPDFLTAAQRLAVKCPACIQAAWKAVHGRDAVHPSIR